MRRTPYFWLQLAFTLLVCSFLLVPVFMSIVAGLTENFFVGVKSGFTLRWIGVVWELYAQTIFRSMYIALATPRRDAGPRRPRRLRARQAPRHDDAADRGVAGAAGRHPGARDRAGADPHLRRLPRLPHQLGASSSSATCSTPCPSWCARCSRCCRRSISRSLEESAASLGAGFWRRFFGIVLPNARSGIVAGALMVVTLSIGEFNLTWMLHTPLNHDAARGARRQLRLDAPRDRQRLYAGLLHHDHAAAGRAAALRRAEHAARRKAHERARPAPRSGWWTAPRRFPTARARWSRPRSRSRRARRSCFLGPSGCGKTTTLRIIAGLESPDAGGRVLFDDEDVTSLPIEQRNVGMVFQSYALFPNMNVADNIAYGLQGPRRGAGRARRSAWTRCSR